MVINNAIESGSTGGHDGPVTDETRKPELWEHIEDLKVNIRSFSIAHGRHMSVQNQTTTQELMTAERILYANMQSTVREVCSFLQYGLPPGGLNFHTVTPTGAPRDITLSTGQVRVQEPGEGEIVVAIVPDNPEDTNMTPINVIITAVEDGVVVVSDGFTLPRNTRKDNIAGYGVIFETLNTPRTLSDTHDPLRRYFWDAMVAIQLGLTLDNSNGPADLEITDSGS